MQWHEGHIELAGCYD